MYSFSALVHCLAFVIFLLRRDCNRIQQAIHTTRPAKAQGRCLSQRRRLASPGACNANDNKTELYSSLPKQTDESRCTTVQQWHHGLQRVTSRKPMAMEARGNKTMCQVGILPGITRTRARVMARARAARTRARGASQQTRPWTS